MTFAGIGRLFAPLALALSLALPARANDGSLEAQFDSVIAVQDKAPRDFTARYDTPLEQQIAKLADGSNGRIGVAAVDLSTGHQLSILGNQRFPMASTSKIAIAATYLEGVDKGRWTLTSEWPLMIPERSKPFSSEAAPVKQGKDLSASELLELMLTRSSNSAADALLAAVGGPKAVDDWARRAGLTHFNLTRDIATLVRDDGEYDPATYVDPRDSSTPDDMVKLLTGIYDGKWLSPTSRDLLIGIMQRCRTGTRRIPALMPDDVLVAHKTGSLHNTSSDVGIISTPDGRTFAVAIYVTGQGSRLNREQKIASIARAIYDGYEAQAPAQVLAEARYDRTTSAP
jgi:beta-lactamase class A